MKKLLPIVLSSCFTAASLSGTYLASVYGQDPKSDLTVTRVDKVPAIGETMKDFELADLDRELVSLADLRKEGPVVVAVLRGYPGYQCPACTKQVADLVSSAKAFEQKKTQVILVYPGDVEELSGKGKEFLKGTTLPPQFHFVLDPGYQFTNRYGLRWDAPKETAYPSTFVVDRDGKVLFSKVSKTHGGRATTQEVLKAIP